MLPTPTRYSLVSGAAEGLTPLTAFDRALLAAGIGNLNLLKVSSILPPQAKFFAHLVIPPGSLVPTAYASIISTTPGEPIAAAVAIGHSADTHGVIMETSGHYTKEEIEARISGMVREAFAVRDLPLVKLEVISAVHLVEQTGCALAAVPLWYD
jgi:arginine decarboxylase